MGTLAPNSPYQTLNAYTARLRSQALSGDLSEIDTSSFGGGGKGAAKLSKVLDKVTQTGVTSGHETELAIQRATNDITIAAIQGQKDLALATQKGDYAITLAKTQATFEQLLRTADQRAELLSRGTFNIGAINRYSGAVTSASAVPVGRYGNINRIGANLEQIGSLDALGLPRGSETATVEQQLRQQSVLATLAALNSRALGRPVGASINSLTGSANALLKTGTTQNSILGSRTLDSIRALNFNPAAAAAQVLNAQSSPQILQQLQSAGKLSLGEGGLITGITKSNEFLDDINNNIATLVVHAGGTPQGGTPAGAAPTTTPAYLSKTGASYASGLFKFGTFGGAASDATPPFVNAPTTSAAKQFAQGFSDQQDDIASKVKDIGQIGASTAQLLTDSFSNFFSAFATGTEKGRIAFRQFASSVFADESKMFSQSAIQQIFGNIGKPATGSANSGFISFASGGMVPVMLTGGEYVFGPQAARRLGPNALHSLNAGRGYAVGGSVVHGGSGVMDDVPGSVPAGSFVVKKSSVQRLGAGYLNSLASGNYARRDAGGFLGMSGGLGYGIAGSLIGGLLGMLLDRKNRAEGALIGAGIGFGAGLLGNSLFGSSPLAQTPALGASSGANPALSYGTYNGSAATGSAGGLGNNAVLSNVLQKLGVAGILGGVTYAMSPSRKVLDTPGIERNAASLEAQQQNYINNRPAGSFVNSARGANGQYNILGYTGPAAEYDYTTPYGYAGGGYVNGSPSTGGASNSNAAVINPIITIHNYGNGNVSSSASTNGGNGPFGGQDFADLLNKHIKSAVQEQLVESQRVGGFQQTSSRYSPNNFF